VANASHEILHRYDPLIAKSKDKQALVMKANEEVASMAKEKTEQALSAVLYEVSCLMKNGFARSDN
jgi:dipeptidase